ncbi:hypothetical protein DPMN_039176 [Dreissena polymorpha]|uniref:Uncharacterized protein n=1 Tax=Dreissena polymorpha TaxID=45954 RepID=A0A9D4RPB9_DREPO|nr:hypothetical protein DPMN_039176 [Dreissena polymorpha]
MGPVAENVCHQSSPHHSVERHILNDKRCNRQTDDGKVISIFRSLYFVAGDTTIGIMLMPHIQFTSPQSAQSPVTRSCW